MSIRTTLLCLTLAGCIVEAPTSTGRETAARPPPAPPQEVKSGALFGDKVELTSVVLAPSRGVTGEAVRVVANFNVIAALDVDYMVFVHVEDVDGRTDRINVDHSPARGTNPTSRWVPGKVVRDDFEIPIPPGMPVKGLNVLMGLWDPLNDKRLPVTNAAKVRTDGRDRVLVATIPVVQP